MVCALAHLFGGGWRQVIASFWPFLIYSATLMTWLKRSGRDAFVLTAFVHALYNATFFSVGAIGNYIYLPLAVLMLIIALASGRRVANRAATD